MPETKKYVSIPTIDNCDLPTSLIRKCKETYRKYGKYKLYDILNADLNSRVKYNAEERDRFKKLELTKRYLYLYRRAMAETMGFVYNDDNQISLLDEEIKEFNDTNICPYCGQPLHKLSQIGSMKGFPKSHFNDVFKRYEHLVLFNRYPEKHSITISLKRYLDNIKLPIQVGYEFAYWSMTSEKPTDISTQRVLEDDIVTVLDDEMYAALSEEDKHNRVKLRSDLSILNFIDMNPESVDYGKLSIYAVYKSNSDNVLMPVVKKYDITLNDIYSLYSENMMDNKRYKDAFDFLNHKSDYYEFGYFAIDTDKGVLKVLDKDKDVNVSVKEYLYENSQLANREISLDIVSIFTAKPKIDNANYVDFGKNIRQLAIEVLSEPYLIDTVSNTDTNGNVNVEEVGKYTFFQWSMDDEASIFILEDNRSLAKLHELDSIINDNKIELYALFKYDVVAGTMAYDDDCYTSVYRQYKGIDKAYSKEIFNEYHSTIYTGDKANITEKQYSLLPDEEKAKYRLQRSFVTYRGYPNVAGVNTSYIKDGLLRVIRCESDKSENISSDGQVQYNKYKRYQPYSHINGEHTGVFLTYSTPGDFEIWYNLNRELWYRYLNEYGKTKVKTKWLNSNDLNEEPRDSKPEDDVSNSWIEYVCSKKIGVTEYISLTDENKLNCEINKVYYDHEWIDVTDKYIQELFNCHTIKEYNNKIGTKDKSFGVDTSSFADITNETYRVYKYWLDNDANIDRSKINLGKDHDIILTSRFLGGVNDDGNTWLYPINESNRASFLNLLNAARPENNSLYYRNDKYIFFRDDIIDNPLEYTRLRPTDSTGSDKLRYTLENVWKCCSFENGDILIYRNHEWLKNESGDYNIDNPEITVANLPMELQQAAFKYGVSISFNIVNDIDEISREYLLRYSNIIITGPGIDEIEYYDTSDKDVTIPETIVKIHYSNIRAGKNASSMQKEYKRRTDSNGEFERIVEGGRGTQVYALIDRDIIGVEKYLELSQKTETVQSVDNSGQTIFTPVKVYPELEGKTSVETWIYWNDIVDIITEPGTIDTANGPLTVFDKTKSPENNPVIYRLETDEEFRSRVNAAVDDTSGFENNQIDPKYKFRYYGKSITDGSLIVWREEDRIDFYTSWYAQADVDMLNSSGERIISISGGYPDKKGNFVPITETPAGLRTMAARSIVYSDDAVSVSDNPDEAETLQQEETQEQDTHIWWNQYGKYLTGAEKNNYIVDVGINFSGWVWTGWDEVEFNDNGDDKSPNIESCTLGNGGLIEAYPFNDFKNYESMGYQRVLFPKEYNKTYSSKVAAVSGKNKLVNIADSTTKEPIRLLRYCNNQECELFKKRLDKSKWSFQNYGSYFLLNTPDNQAHPGLSLDEATPNINLDGSVPAKDKYKTETSQIKFLNSEFEAPDSTAAFGRRDGTSELRNKEIIIDPDSGSETYSLQGFSLDVYPWHYKNRRGDDDDRDINTHGGKIVKYLMHSVGGNATPNDLRFEFEYKYATDEFSISKMSSYTSDYSVYKIKEQLDALKQISHDKTIIPIRDRPIREFQEQYKEVLFNTFENTLIRLNNSESPYSLFNKEELLIMNNILTDLFTFNKNNPNSTEFIDFKLEIISLMNEMIDYEYYRRNYWDEGKQNSEYLLNKEIFDKILNTYDHKEDIINNGEIVADEFTFKNFFKDQIKYKTIKLDDINRNVYDNKPIKRMIVKRTYNALVDTTLSEIIQSYGDIPDYSNAVDGDGNRLDKFVGWAKNDIASVYWNLAGNEANYPVDKNKSIDLYLVYDFETIKLTKNFLNLIESFEPDSTVYLKFDLEEDIGTMWYRGKDAIKEELKNRLADLHERIALPSEFMCCLFNFISASKRYDIYADENGNISSLFVPSGLITSPDKPIGLSIARKSTGSKYNNAVITKPWKLAKDTSNGQNIKEQYYLLYNDNEILAYSFFNNGWITDIYGEELAKKKFPLMKFSENPIKYIFPESRLIKIIPVSTEEHESVLILVYNKGIGLVDVSTGWITDNTNVISCFKLFGSNDVNITDCILNKFNTKKESLIILSSDRQIASYDINSDIIYPSNSESPNAPLLLGSNTNIVTTSQSRRLNSSRISSEVEINSGNLDGYLPNHVGLTIAIKELTPSNYDGDPWVLNNDIEPSLNLPQTLTDNQYAGMKDIDKEKYHIHPKLTVRYAMNSQHGFDAEHDETLDWTYRSLYIDEFTQHTEGTFEILYNGEVISTETYFNTLSDELRSKCKIYKLETINYTFVRFTFSSRTGTGIYDSELDRRMTKPVTLYAFYYKTGETVDEYYGYKILQTEHIVNGEDTIYSDDFNEYIKENTANKNDKFNTNVVPGWKTNNPQSQYKNNVVSSIPILSNITKIFPINGYDDANESRYIYQYIISDGVKSQLIQFYNNTLYIMGEYDYNDGNELVAVKSLHNENETYLIYKNQRVVVLQTYEYVPSEYSIGLNNKIKLIASTDDPESENTLTYLTDDNRVVNITFAINRYNNTSSIFIGKDLSKFYKDKNVNIVSMINTNVEQTDKFKFIPNYMCWRYYEGNDKNKHSLSQIN